MKAKVKDSVISADWGDVVENTTNTVVISWNGRIGIYTKAKNEITYKDEDNANR